MGSNTTYLSAGATINVINTFTGSVKNIVGPSTVIKEGYQLVNVTPGTTASAVKDQFTLRDPGWTLVEDEPYLIVARMPKVDSIGASITAYNTTAANITFTLDTSYSGATGAWVNLTNQSDHPDIITHQLSTAIPVGELQKVQLTGLKPGQTYQLTIALQNTSIGAGTSVYTHADLYTAPIPEIVFVNATTGADVASPLTLETGKAVTIRADITNASAELKNETIQWALQGSGITMSGQELIYPYNVTLETAADNAEGNITVTVAGITKKLDIVKDAPIPPVPPRPPVSSSGDGNMDNAFRVLFETFGGSYVAPATGLSYGDRIAKPADPVKDGYTFAGWYKDDACTIAWIFKEDAIPGDISLYAKWTSSQATTAATTAATTSPTIKATASATTMQTTSATTTAVPAVTTAGAQPTLMQTPAPVVGLLFGLLAAGILLRKRE